MEEQQHLPACWRADPRLERPHQDQCQRMLTQEAFDADNITLVQLFPQGELVWSLTLAILDGGGCKWPTLRVHYAIAI